MQTNRKCLTISANTVVSLISNEIFAQELRRWNNGQNQTRTKFWETRLQSGWSTNFAAYTRLQTVIAWYCLVVWNLTWGSARKEALQMWVLDLRKTYLLDFAMESWQSFHIKANPKQAAVIIDLFWNRSNWSWWWGWKHWSWDWVC